MANDSERERSLLARVLRIRFRAADSPWKVLAVETDSGRATVVGEFEQIEEGLEYDFRGRWDVHPQYGEQFRADAHYPRPPRTLRGMIAYLSSGLIAGIGPKMAKRIVDRFGDKTFDVISTEPERLLEVPGIAEVKKEQLVRSFNEHRNLQEVVTHLTGLGLSANMAVRLYREYRDDTINVITNNPYRLTRDIFGIGFRRADEIARASGVDPCSPQRLRAAVTYVLQGAAERAGHTFLPGKQLCGETYRLLEDIAVRGDGTEAEHPSLEDIETAVDDAERDGIIRVEDEAAYLLKYHRCESEVARRLRQVHGQGIMAAPEPQAMDQILNRVQRKLGMEYAPEQEEAVRQAFRAGVMVITGGPGTGKTTIVRGIMEVAELLGGGLRVLLAAPTGRAARKLGEVTGHQAHTLHRLLGYSFVEGRPVFRHDAEDPLEGDVLIVDESSMVDIELAHHLMEAVGPTMRLILVGDADQLPSVGPGNFLRDLVRSELLPVVRLEKIFRQEEVSDIVLNAHRINSGQEPVFAGGGDSYFVSRDTPEEICEHVVQLVARLTRAGRYGIEDVQVLSPMHRGAAGVANLNNQIQRAMNPPSPGRGEISRGGVTYREGDKVMCLRNNYEKGQSGIFNGNLGVIRDVISPDDGLVDEPTLEIDFDGELVPYGQSELNELGLAYATTVHKAQGSEFPVVLAVLSTSQYVMLQRNLLYTAVTRAERLLVLVGQWRALRIAIQNNSVDERYSRLALRLSGG
ncbi:MAG: ATP-dependent RecD-like DNA helicase [Bacillota bacterium]